MMPLLQVKQLAIHLPQRFNHNNTNNSKYKTVVHDVNFEVQSGETLALIGESGSGKSMTALAIMQLLPAQAELGITSEIWLEKMDISRANEAHMQTIRGAHIGMVFQEPMTALNPVTTIGAQITEIIAQHQKTLAPSICYDQTLELLKNVQIPDPRRLYGAYPHQLSGGMRQRVVIAMAIAARPKLLICDEPTTALDVTIQAQILKLLKELQQTYGMAMLFITHHLAVAKQIAEHIAVMYQGQLVEHAKNVDFFKAPQHAYSQQLQNTYPHWQIPTPNLNEHPKKINPVLQIENLKVYFPIKRRFWQKKSAYFKAVDDVSLKLHRGQTLALVGESGCGKTTLGKTLIRLLKITSGKIFWPNELSKTKENLSFQNQIQMIFQDPFSSMNPRMLVFDVIAEGLRYLSQLSQAQIAYRVAELLAQVGLSSDSQRRYPHEFSGGQRQRIAIARALAVNPQIVICDEPTSALDVSVQAQILALLQELQQRLHLSYFLITHDLAVVAQIAHYVAVMQAGKIVEQGPVEQVLFAPQHPYTQNLLNAVPKLIA